MLCLVTPFDQIIKKILDKWLAFLKGISALSRGGGDQTIKQNKNKKEKRERKRRKKEERQGKLGFCLENLISKVLQDSKG